MARTIAISTVLAILAAVGGCATVHPPPRQELTAASFEQLVAAGVEETPAASKLAFDVRAVASLAEIDETLAEAGSGDRRLALRVKECQCRAAASSTKANLIDLERQVPSHSATCGCRHGAAGHALRDDLLKLRARDERNEAAGEALELFYQLAEATANRELLSESVTLAQAAIDNFEQLRRQGLEIDANEDALQRRKDTLVARRAELDLSLDQLNGRLHVLLGGGSAGLSAFRPLADLKVRADAMDADEQVAIGMAWRADLAALDLLSHRLSVETLPTARSTLQQEDNSLGLPSLAGPLAHIMHGESDSKEMIVRRRQLRYLHTERTRIAAAEIRGTVGAIGGQLRRVSLAKTMLAGRKQRLAEVQEAQDAGRATEFDVIEARLSVNEAQSDLVGAVVAWQTARVQLKRAQGLLAIECGFGH